MAGIGGIWFEIGGRERFEGCELVRGWDGGAEEGEEGEEGSLARSITDFESIGGRFVEGDVLSEFNKTL